MKINYACLFSFFFFNEEITSNKVTKLQNTIGIIGGICLFIWTLLDCSRNIKKMPLFIISFVFYFCSLACCKNNISWNDIKLFMKEKVFLKYIFFVDLLHAHTRRYGTYIRCIWAYYSLTGSIRNEWMKWELKITQEFSVTTCTENSRVAGRLWGGCLIHSA